MADIEIVPTRVMRPDPGALPDEALSAELNAPTDEWVVPNNGSMLIAFANEHASETATLTIHTPQTVDGLAVADRVYTLAAQSRSRPIGPWPVQTYGSRLRVSATAEGTLKIAARRYA